MEQMPDRSRRDVLKGIAGISAAALGASGAEAAGAKPGNGDKIMERANAKTEELKSLFERYKTVEGSGSAEEKALIQQMTEKIKEINQLDMELSSEKK